MFSKSLTSKVNFSSFFYLLLRVLKRLVIACVLAFAGMVTEAIAISANCGLSGVSTNHMDHMDHMEPEMKRLLQEHPNVASRINDFVRAGLSQPGHPLARVEAILYKEYLVPQSQVFSYFGHAAGLPGRAPSHDVVYTRRYVFASPSINHNLNNDALDPSFQPGLSVNVAITVSMLGTKEPTFEIRSIQLSEHSNFFDLDPSRFVDLAAWIDSTKALPSAMPPLPELLSTQALHREISLLLEETDLGFGQTDQKNYAPEAFQAAAAQEDLDFILPEPQNEDGEVVVNYKTEIGIQSALKLLRAERFGGPENSAIQILTRLNHAGAIQQIVFRHPSGEESSEMPNWYYFEIFLRSQDATCGIRGTHLSLHYTFK